MLGATRPPDDGGYDGHITFNVMREKKHESSETKGNATAAAKETKSDQKTQESQKALKLERQREYGTNDKIS